MGKGIGWGKGLYEVDERGEGENEVKGGRNELWRFDFVVSLSPSRVESYPTLSISLGWKL